MKHDAPTYHILGAGVAGLSAAKLLRMRHPESKITVYEAAAQPGGRCRSYFDTRLGAVADMATHVILGANKNALSLLKEPVFSGFPPFYDYARHKRTAFFPHHISEAALALFNQPLRETAPGIVLNTAWKLFPFLPGCLKVWYSKNDLSSALIAPLSAYPDTLKTGFVLKSFAEADGKITKLFFNKACVEVAPEDKIICALDAQNYARIFQGPVFDFNCIVNIIFRTSMALSFPGRKPFLGIKNALPQWLFAAPGFLSVTVSDASAAFCNDKEAARNVWKQICEIRGREAAFMPPYRMIKHRRATLRHDRKNNSLRPDSPVTRWKNMLLAGDWTMKNYPCSIEAAVLSARRATAEI